MRRSPLALAVLWLGGSNFGIACSPSPAAPLATDTNPVSLTTTPSQAEPAEPAVAAEPHEAERVPHHASSPAMTARQAWWEQMHRCRPDQDWRQIERNNHKALQAQRTQSRSRSTYRGSVPQALALGATTQAAGAGSLVGQHASDRPSQTVRALGYWEEVGSRNQAGQTLCSALGRADVSGPRNWYVGSVGGGVWRSSLGTSLWTPLSDDWFAGAEELIALPGPTPQDPERLIFRQDAQVFASPDGGDTWSIATGPGTEEVVEWLTLQALPGSPTSTLLGLVRIETLAQGGQTWVVRSQDAGQTFERLWQAPELGRGDLWMPQIGPHAGMHVYLGLNGRVYQSTDGGNQFLLRGQTLPDATDTHLAGSEAGGITLFVVVANAGDWELYRSRDAGRNHVALGTLLDYGGSPRSMVGFATNSDWVVYGGLEAQRSTDGGQSFQSIHAWGEYFADPANRLHPDVRAFDRVVEKGADGWTETLFVHTDGGSYLSTDGGQTVSNLCLSGLGNAQVYSTHSAPNDPDLIAAGTQDQGYQLGTRAGSFDQGPSTDFAQPITGDYGHLVSSDANHDWVFSVYPGIASSTEPGFILVQEGATQPTWTTLPMPPAGDSLWLPPIVADPTEPSAFYFLADQLWRVHWNGSQWVSTVHSQQDFSQGPSRYLAALDIHPVDPMRVVACTDSGVLWWSLDGGVTWTEASSPGPDGHLFYGNRVLMHPSDPHWVLAAGSGYNGPGVLVSYDGGDHWSGLGTGLPATFVYDLAWAPDGSGDLFAATEAGPFRYLAALDAWESLLGATAPAVAYWSVESLPGAHRVRFGTMGRGIWDFVMAAPERSIGDWLCTPAVPNSTLVEGRLEVHGTALAETPSLLLIASQLPPQEMGQFLLSQTAVDAYVPFWSDGFLCLGTNYRTLGLQSTGSQGRLELTLDPQAWPVTPPGVLTAGQTWYFQAWHTDFVLVPTGNFTQAVGIRFH